MKTRKIRKYRGGWIISLSYWLLYASIASSLVVKVQLVLSKTLAMER